MVSKSMQLTAILLIAGLIVGAGIGYYAAPGKTNNQQTIVYQNPLKGTTIKIGDIASTTAELESETSLVQKIIMPDVNNYLTTLGYGATINILIDNADGQANTCLEKIQGFKSQGLTNIIGGKYSSHAQASLSYVNANNMLLLSPGSTSPTLSIPNDNLYRLVVPDTAAAPAVAEMLRTWGIKAIVILQRADTWADGNYNLLANEFPARGGVIVERYRYAPETTEWSTYLAQMDGKLGEMIATYGKEHIAVQVFALDEIVPIITQATSFPNVNSVQWFGHEKAGRNQRVVDDAGAQGVHFKIFSLMIAPAGSDKFQDVNNRFTALIKSPPSTGQIATYDAGWVITKSIIDSGSQDSKVLISVLPGVCDQTWGAMGWLKLDANGDLKPSLYNIWGYATVNGAITFQTYGQYNFLTKQVVWDPVALASQGLSMPTG